MKLLVTKATTSKTMLVFVQDSSSTVGAGLTGLAWNTAGLSWFYYREGAGTGATAVTLATMTIGTWATGGFVELDAADMPGWYELGVPNAVIATGVDFVGMQLKGAANMAPVNIEIQLSDLDMNDGVRAGLTSLPNAAADAAGGLPISDGGGLDLDAKLANTNEVTTARMATLTDWIDGGRLDLLLDAIPTTAMRGTDNAALASEVTAARMATLTDWIDGGRLDLLLDAIKLVTDKFAFTVANQVDSNALAISGSTDAADNLEASSLGVVPGACEGVPTTTVVQTNLAESTDDHYIGRIIVFTSGNAAGEASDITDYTGATGTVTITAVTTAPAAPDTFVIV